MFVELITTDVMVGEDEGVAEVCVQVDHVPMRTIVFVTLATQPVSATGTS